MSGLQVQCLATRCWVVVVEEVATRTGQVDEPRLLHPRASPNMGNITTTYIRTTPSALYPQILL
jgi:hypothetical protein